MKNSQKYSGWYKVLSATSLVDRASPGMLLLKLSVVCVFIFILAVSKGFGQTSGIDQETSSDFLLAGTKQARELNIMETEAKLSLHIHLISGSKEYHSEHSLKEFKNELEQKYKQVRVTASWGEDAGKYLPNIELLAEADLMLVFTRRMTLPKDQLSYIKQHVEAEKPVIGLRTASHAFQGFPELDSVVFGGNYNGHGDDESVELTIAEYAEKHPVLNNVRPWTRTGKIYLNPGLGPNTQILLFGKGMESGINEPLAWINTFGKGGCAFYTSMGLPSDFRNENFRQLLINAISWTTGRKLLLH